MAKKILFHGTTYQNYLNIIENGFGLGSRVWECSDLDCTYFHDMEKYIMSNECDSENEVIRYAFESAQTAAASSQAQDNRLIVLRLEIDSNLCDDDLSCPNMDSIATVVNNSDINISMITDVFVSHDAYTPFLTIYYLRMIWNSEYFCKDNISLELYNIMEQLKESEFPFIDSFLEFEWQKLL